MGRKLLISILSFFILYGIYYFGIPAIVNLPSRTDLIEQSVYQKAGYKISITNPKLKMGIIPSVIISTDNFSLLNDDNSKALEISDFQINLRLLPLLIKKLDIKDLSAQKIDLNFVFEGDSKIKLGQYNLEKFSESSIKFDGINLKLGNYNIKLTDNLYKKNLLLKGKYIETKFKNNKHLSLLTSAELYYNNNKKSDIQTNLNILLPFSNISSDKLDITGYVTNLDLSEFSEYAKYFSKDKIKSLSGIINFTTKTETKNDKHKLINIYAKAKNLGIFEDNIKTSVHSKDVIEIFGEFLTINNGIQIKDLKIKGVGIDGFVSGQITKLNSKLPNLNLKLGVNKSKAEKIIDILPVIPNPDIDILLLKKTGFWGDASGSLEIKGKADYPNVHGNVLVTNAYMVKPIPNSEKATIKLIFKGDYFDLDVNVPTSPTQNVWVKGPIKIDKDKTADLMITSTDDVDLKTAQIVLNPLHKILDFELGPVPIMDIRGKGGINLHVLGTKESPHAWGEFRFKDAIVSFLDIHNLEIKNGSGNLKFDNQSTVFESKTATLNGQPINITGICSLIGKLDFKVITNNQDLSGLLKSIQTSPMLIDIQNLIKPIESAKGNANIKFNLFGQVKDVNDIVFNKNIFAKGTIELLSDTIKFKDTPTDVKNISGFINFNNFDADFNLQSSLKKSLIKLDGKIKNKICNIKVISNKFNVGDAIESLNIKIPYKDDISTINTSFIAKYNGDIENIELDKISLKGKIYSNKGAKSSIILNDANYELNNSNFKLPLIKGIFNGSPYFVSLNISKIFSPDIKINGNGKIDSFDLALLNSISNEQLKDFQFIKGTPQISFRAKNNNFNIFTVLDDIELLYKPLNSLVNLKSGNVLFQNNTLNLNKVNAIFNGMPIFADGKIYNLQKNRNMNLYLNIKPNQDFLDQIYNKHSIYPIKLKGDVILSSKINGTTDNINTKSTLDIKENSSIYYMGSVIGDVNNPVKITVDSNYSPNKLKINNLKYDKMIMSQNNKPFVNTQLNASGSIKLISDNAVEFNNFKIKTQNPTDAKIFNIIFRKPFMKQGVFTSDLILNGTSINPKILGKLDITSIDIPFFDSTISGINLNFRNDKINILAGGKVLTNDVNLEAIMKNKLTPPYMIENVKLKLPDLNINKITETLRDIEAESARTLTVHQNSAQTFDISQIIVNNAEIQADKIKVRNIDANDFRAKLKITDKNIIDVDNFKFTIAQGNVFGNFKYDIPSEKTNLDIHLNNANASIMSEALFDLKGQVYGSVNGDFVLSCTGNSNDNCFKTLSGEGTFKIADGRMPKLGSLEYLLKAGNIWKGGITGLSINSLIDLVTPLKTGDFESISGDIHISNGLADKINVYSKGNDLNMYMTGNYNIVSSIADMKVFGSLSKNITSVFGKIKNASLNTLFNTIPGINDSTEKLLLQENIGKIPNINDVSDIYRIFAVEINGDINGTGYVKSFRWVK